jgi:hypothetical protein
MSDARWIDAADDIASAAHHSKMAIRLHEIGGMDGEDLEAYRNRMAFMQAMQSGYTLLEGGIERVFDILGEAKPTGADYHAVMVRRASRAVPGERPAMVGSTVAAAMDEARRFRHVVRKNYDNFRVGEAGSAVAAARLLSTDLVGELALFKSLIDPDGNSGGEV